MDIAESLLDTVGNTPLVRLNRLSKDLSCQIVVKLETANPGGSVKDRPAIAMIDEAEKQGWLKPGGTIVEPTSGNTGVGLAIVAAQRGYKCVFVVTSKVNEEKVSLLRAYGAEVVVCPVAVAPEDPQSYYSVAERLVKEIPGAYRPDQYSNPYNTIAHEKTTGPEIWQQTDGTITHFVCGVGTGGTISGVGHYLKSQNPNVQIIGADPEGSVYSGGSGRPYLVEGVGEDFWPTTFDRDITDRVIAVSDHDSFITARETARTEGLLVGGSGGLAIAAALKLGKELTAQDLVVVLIPDSGRGYLSRVFNDNWMTGYGFINDNGQTVDDILKQRQTGIPPLVYVNPTDTVKRAVETMRGHGLSQLPVAKGEMPIAAAEVMGSVDELALMDKSFQDPEIMNQPVETVISDPLPTIGIGQSVQHAVELLENSPALLVLSGGRPTAVLSRTDVLQFLTHNVKGNA